MRIGSLMLDGALARRARTLLVASTCTALLLAAALPIRAIAAPPRGGVANLAMIGEPQTLDPMASTADLVGTIMQHVYELLYTYDANSNVVPMLAETLPTVSSDALVYTIPLRHGVKFHNGKEMTSDDVLASLDRWMKMAPRGKAVAKEVKSVEAKGPYTVVITLNRPYAPLVAHLALSNGFAAIMAKESIAEPLTQFIGTGPYMFKERKPDQYVQLVRFDGYSARSEPASGYGGKREAILDELRFVPVPNANTRVEGILAGQYQFADVLPVEAYARVSRAANVKAVLTAPFGFPYIVLNTKQGPLSNVTLRQSVQAALNDADMMAAAFGEPNFYDTEPNHYAKNTPFYSTAGTQNYGKGDAKKAASLAATAKYDGTPIKVLTSQQYDFHYRMALVMAENLKAAGYKVDMQVVDWSTLIQRRNDPALWDIYITHSAVLPEPTLTPPQLGDGAPGWWSSSAKEAALAAFNAEADPKKRAALWGNVQNVVFTEVPYIRVGGFNNLTARSAKLDGYVPMPWPFFWNTGLSK
ncbi:MAG TPA: ABC transporter substrate-binding protein [Casimicrobiaceae bacterium]|nr:ABC transporter substrate-binding protein [Casimicrobiaceae bacterium]